MLPAMLPVRYSPKNSYISKQKAKHDDQTLFSPHRCGAGDHRHGDLVADRMRCSSASARPSQAEEAAPPSAQGTSSSAPASASQILVMQGPEESRGPSNMPRLRFSALLPRRMSSTSNFLPFSASDMRLFCRFSGTRFSRSAATFPGTKRTKQDKSKAS